VLLGTPSFEGGEKGREEEDDQSQYEQIRLRLRRHQKNYAVPALEADCLLKNLKAAISPLEAALLIDLLSTLSEDTPSTTTSTKAKEKDNKNNKGDEGGKGKEKVGPPSVTTSPTKGGGHDSSRGGEKQRMSSAVINYKMNDKGVMEVIETQSGTLLDSFVSGDEMSSFSDTSSDEDEDLLAHESSTDSDSEEYNNNDFAFEPREVMSTRNHHHHHVDNHPLGIGTGSGGKPPDSPNVATPADNVELQLHAAVENGSLTLVYDPNSVAAVFEPSTEMRTDRIFTEGKRPFQIKE